MLYVTECLAYVSLFKSSQKPISPVPQHPVVVNEMLLGHPQRTRKQELFPVVSLILSKWYSLPTPKGTIQLS